MYMSNEGVSTAPAIDNDGKGISDNGTIGDISTDYNTKRVMGYTI